MGNNSITPAHVRGLSDEETVNALRIAEIQDSILNLPIDLTVGDRSHVGYDKALETRQKKVNFLVAMIICRLNITRARLIAGVDNGELQSWRQGDRFFKSVEASLYDDILDLAEEKLHEAVADGDMKAVTFILRTKGRNRGYVEKVEMDHGIKDFDKALLEGRQRAFANKQPIEAALNETHETHET